VCLGMWVLALVVQLGLEIGRLGNEFFRMENSRPLNAFSDYVIFAAFALAVIVNLDLVVAFVL
jgi:hypothetical protein